MSIMLPFIVLAIFGAGVAVGVLIGYFIGRKAGRRQASQGFAVLPPSAGRE